MAKVTQLVTQFGLASPSLEGREPKWTAPWSTPSMLVLCSLLRELLISSPWLEVIMDTMARWH